MAASPSPFVLLASSCSSRCRLNTCLGGRVRLARCCRWCSRSAFASRGAHSHSTPTTASTPPSFATFCRQPIVRGASCRSLVLCVICNAIRPRPRGRSSGCSHCRTVPAHAHTPSRCSRVSATTSSAPLPPQAQLVGVGRLRFGVAPASSLPPSMSGVSRGIGPHAAGICAAQPFRSARRLV